MHDEARAYVEARRSDEVLAVLEIGGRWINGGVRDLFPNADPYVSLDIVEGPGVDIVANAATWEPDRLYDLIVCTEVFEHTPEWPQILRTMATACCPGGRLILTMAGPGRPPHGASGGPHSPNEFYANVYPDHLRAELHATGWTDVDVDYLMVPGDTRATATRATPEEGTALEQQLYKVRITATGEVRDAEGNLIEQVPIEQTAIVTAEQAKAMLGQQGEQP